MRYNYITQLISGCREMAEERMEIDHPELRKFHPEIMSSGYLNSMLLCDVVDADTDNRTVQLGGVRSIEFPNYIGMNI